MIPEADLSFDNQQIALTQFKVFFGESDLQMTGTLENFIGYALDPAEVLHGKLNFSAQTLNFNPFLQWQLAPLFEERFALRRVINVISITSASPWLASWPRARAARPQTTLRGRDWTHCTEVPRHVQVWFALVAFRFQLKQVYGLQGVPLVFKSRWKSSF